MTYTGHVLNGQVIFDGPAPPEGVEFRLEVVAAVKPPVRRIPSLAERLKGAIGTAVDLPADAAENHDRYISEAARAT